MSDPHTTAPPFSPDELPVLTEEDNMWHGAVGFDASLRLLELARDPICWPLVLQLALAAARVFAQWVFARGLGCWGGS